MNYEKFWPITYPISRLSTVKCMHQFPELSSFYLLCCVTKFYARTSLRCVVSTTLSIEMVQF